MKLKILYYTLVDSVSNRNIKDFQQLNSIFQGLKKYSDENLSAIEYIDIIDSKYLFICIVNEKHEKETMIKDITIDKKKYPEVSITDKFFFVIASNGDTVVLNHHKNAVPVKEFNKIFAKSNLVQYGFIEKTQSKSEVKKAFDSLRKLTITVDASADKKMRDISDINLLNQSYIKTASASTKFNIHYKKNINIEEAFDDAIDLSRDLKEARELKLEGEGEGGKVFLDVLKMTVIKNSTLEIEDIPKDDKLYKHIFNKMIPYI